MSRQRDVVSLLALRSAVVMAALVAIVVSAAPGAGQGTSGGRAMDCPSAERALAAFRQDYARTGDKAYLELARSMETAVASCRRDAQPPATPGATSPTASPAPAPQAPAPDPGRATSPAPAPPHCRDPVTRVTLDDLWERKVWERLRGLEEATEMLSAIRRDLEKDSTWWLGKEREFGTLLLQASNLVGGILTDLLCVGFDVTQCLLNVPCCFGVGGGYVRDIITAARDHDAVAGIVFDYAVKGVVKKVDASSVLFASRDVLKAGVEMMKTRRDFEETRKEIARQLAALDRRLRQVNEEIFVLHRKVKPAAVSELLRAYAESERTCRARP